MKAVIVNGDMFLSDCVVLCHQVNCMGVMGSGVAKTVKFLYPKAFDEYKSIIDSLGHQVLGGCLLVEIEKDKKYIANLTGQFYYKGCNGNYKPKDNNPWISPSSLPEPNDKWIDESTKLRFTNYEAFYRGLTKLLIDMNCYGLKSLAFPYKIGSDRGGADWEVILSMINSVFGESEIEVKIYKL